MTDFIWVRKHNEPTPDYLGRVLEDLELRDMARRARLGHFDDFACPREVDDGFNITRLVRELGEHMDADGVGAVRRRAMRRVIAYAKAGEFDATKAETDRWAASDEGQKTFKELLRGMGEK